MSLLASSPLENVQKNDSKIAPYRTVIISGHVVEVREYDRAPTGLNKPFEDDYDPFANLDVQDAVEQQEINTQHHLDQSRLKDMLKSTRTSERRQQTVRDARNKVRRLALSNFGHSDKFITLTYKKNMTDIDQADKDFKNFIKRFKYHFGVEELKYLAVREFQQRGAIHFHLVCNWDKHFTSENEIRKSERLLGKEIWKQGFVDIKQIDHVDNIGAYISKYMTKSVSISFFKNKKIYLCSKGLQQSIKLTGEEADKYFLENNLDQKKETFKNEYPTEYQGNCQFKEYNYQRQI